jgi:two-component system response regulator HydG
MDIDDMLDMDDLSPDLWDGEVSPATEQSASADGLATAGAPAFLIGKTLKEVERWATEQALKLANNNRKETAKILGISERNLYRLIQRYDLK